jgi:hypothetical protein
VIDVREEQDENAFDSMRVSSEPGSSAIHESDLHDEKQDEQIT